MKEYRVYVEDLPWLGVVRIHVQRRRGENKREVLHFKDGQLTGTMLHDCESAPDGLHFLELPYDLFNALEKGMVERVEQRGGAPTQQSLRGEVKRLDSEVGWFRELLTKVITRS